MTDILIVDDHPLYRAGLAGVLAAGVADMHISEAGSAEDALVLLEAGRHADVALIDARLPGMDGFAAVGIIGLRHPKTACILFSGDDGADMAGRARAAGAAGFFPKSLGVAQLVEAIRTALAGGSFFPSDEQRRSGAALGPQGLSLRQLEVLALLGKGCSNKRIAKDLSIAERTVKWHITEIFAHLQVENRTQALIEASRRRLIAAP